MLFLLKVKGKKNVPAIPITSSVILLSQDNTSIRPFTPSLLISAAQISRSCSFKISIQKNVLIEISDYFSRFVDEDLRQLPYLRCTKSRVLAMVVREISQIERPSLAPLFFSYSISLSVAAPQSIVVAHLLLMFVFLDHQYTIAQYSA